MKVNEFSKVGSHKSLNQENQDYIMWAENDEFLAAALADGATACKMGRDGAKLACEAAINIAENEGTVFFSYSEEKIAYLLTEHILYYIESKKDKKRPSEEYGSTFLMVFLEKKTGRTVFANLGDGAVISVKDNRLIYIAEPKLYGGNPCLTTTKGAHSTMKVLVTNTAYGENVFLCSDGFLNMLYDSGIYSALCEYDLETLNRELAAADNADDCSYVTFIRKRK